METQVTTRDLVDAIAIGNSRDIQQNFNSLLASRLTDAIADYKTTVVDQIFTGMNNGENHNQED